MKNMKVLVYGGAEEVERIATFLEDEMPFEVKRMIMSGRTLEMSMAEILRKTEDDLYDSIGRNEVIILADFLTTMATKLALTKKYPNQKFVGYGQGILRTVKKLKKVCVLTTQKIRRLELYQRMKAVCQETKIIEMGSTGWQEMMRKRNVEKIELRRKLESAQGAPILVFHPDLSLARIKELVDWRNEVIDVERELLADVKAALGVKNWT